MNQWRCKKWVYWLRSLTADYSGWKSLAFASLEYIFGTLCPEGQYWFPEGNSLGFGSPKAAYRDTGGVELHKSFDHGRQINTSSFCCKISVDRQKPWKNPYEETLDTFVDSCAWLMVQNRTKSLWIECLLTIESKSMSAMANWAAAKHVLWTVKSIKSRLADDQHGLTDRSYDRAIAVPIPPKMYRRNIG